MERSSYRPMIVRNLNEYFPYQHPDRVGERRVALGEDHRAGHRGGPLRRADPPEAAREVDRGEADGARGHPVRGGAEEQAQVQKMIFCKFS